MYLNVKAEKQKIVHKQSYENYQLNKKILASNLEDLVKIIAEQIEQFDNINSVTALYELSKNYKGLTQFKLMKELPGVMKAVDSLITRLIPRLKELNSKSLTSAIKALALLGKKIPQFEQKLIFFIALKIDSFEPQELSYTAWALAKLGIRDKVLLSKLISAAKKKTPELDRQGQANLLWGLTLLENIERELFQGILSRIKFTELNKEEKYQIYEVYFYMQTVNKDMLDIFPEKLKEDISEYENNYCHQPDMISEFQYKVSQALGVNHEQEYYIGLFPVDIAFPEQRLVIECDGPHHYLSNGEQKLKYIFKDKILAALGWQVVRIKKEDWDKSSDYERKFFLQSILNNFQIAPMGSVTPSSEIFPY